MLVMVVLGLLVAEAAVIIKVLEIEIVRSRWWWKVVEGGGRDGGDAADCGGGDGYY